MRLNVEGAQQIDDRQLDARVAKARARLGREARGGGAGATDEGGDDATTGHSLLAGVSDAIGEAHSGNGKHSASAGFYAPVTLTGCSRL